MASPRLRLFGHIAAVAALGLTFAAGVHAASHNAPPSRVEVSSALTSVTMYSAGWCPACRSLEARLTERNIPFEKIDVDQNRELYERARNESGMGNGIPLTHITTNTSTWVQGADADAVERAYKGD